MLSTCDASETNTQGFALFCQGMPIQVRELIRLLENKGWILLSVKGSHRQFRHPTLPLVITVPGKEGKELALGTLNEILKKAGLK